MGKKVSVIIVNFNTKEILKDCLKNLSGSYDPLEVIVVDNNSHDGSVDMVRNDYPWVQAISLNGNQGLAAASNVGLKQSTGDYILYLGSDAFPKPGVITGLVDYMDNHEAVGIATAKLLLRSGKPDMDAHRGFPTPWTALTHFSGLDRLISGSRLFDRYFIGYEELSHEHEIDLCISHFMFVRREIFEKVGNWDESFFVFGEDVDFCYRVKEAGYKIMYLPQFIATHYKGSSIGIRKESKDVSTASQETKKKMLKSTTQAMELFYKKHYAKKYPVLVTWLVLTGVKGMAKLRDLGVK